VTAAAVVRPRRRRILFALLGVAALAVAGFAVAVILRREAAARHLAAVVAEIDRTDPGWRLDDLERARPDVPDAENSAGALSAAFLKLTRPSQSLMTGLDGVHADVPPNVRLAPADSATARALLAANAAAVPAVLALADFPRGRHPIAHSPDAVSTLLRHADHMTQVDAWVLEPLGLLAVQDGDTARALAVIRARLNLGRSLRDEPVLISQLVRGRYRRLAARGLERLLGHATLTADQLAAVRRELEAELPDDPWAVAMRGERAMADQFLSALHDGTAKASNVKPMLLRNYNPPPLQRVGDRLHDFIAPETDAAHAFALDLLTRAVATAKLPWHERPAAFEALYAEWQTGPEPARWLALAADLPKWLNGLLLDQARIRTAVAAVAAEQHRVARGDWPASLAELGPLPDDPFTGKPLGFRRLADGIVVYSVGPNLRDDGGELAKDDGNVPKEGDVGFRLWDVPRRNRPPAGGEP
jgi:hypothetical protein